MNTDSKKKSLLADVWSVQTILDASFQRCYNMCEKMPKKLGHHIYVSRELHEIRPDTIREWLEPIANEVYRDMARTLFQVLPLLQPQDFEQRRDVNFYFWPAYHMVLVNRRLFYAVDELGEKLKLMGCGLWGDPRSSRGLEEWQEYNDCCHARWFNYATRRPKRMEEFLPGSVYLWFNTQMPCASANPYDLIRSFTILAPDSGHDLDDEPSAPVLRLDSASEHWGHELKEALNGKVGRYRRNPGHVFPNRPDKPAAEESSLSEVRCRLLALFMHSAFRGDAPVWLNDLYAALDNAGLQRVLDREGTSKDPIAQDWGDMSKNRELFRCWSTITLQPMLNAVPESSSFSTGAVPGHLDGMLTNQSIGSSYMFSSVPLRKEYLAVVRDYVRKVYAMMRNFEQAINTQNLLYRARRTLVSQSAVLLHHEFNAMLKDRYQTVEIDIAKCDPAVVTLRRDAWRSIVAHVSLLNSWSQAFLHREPRAKSELQRRFLYPLLALHERDALERGLMQVAGDVYANNDRYAGATVSFPLASAGAPIHLEPDEYNRCFLLVSEVVRNFCKHEERLVEACWWMEIKSNILHIRMEYPTLLQERPRSNTFDCLDTLLRDLELGTATVTLGDGKLHWLVSVYFSHM